MLTMSSKALSAGQARTYHEFRGREERIDAIAKDAQLFTNDREKLPAALGHEVFRESAHTPQHKQEQSIQPPQQEIAPKHEHSYEMGMGLGL